MWKVFRRNAADPKLQLERRIQEKIKINGIKITFLINNFLVPVDPCQNKELPPELLKIRTNENP